MRISDEDSPGRTLAVAVAAMLGVALLVGLAVGGALVSVLAFDGGGSTEATGGSPPSLVVPKYQPTKSAEDDLGLPEASEPASQEKKQKKKQPRIKLFMAPQSPAPGERINVNGVYRKGDGATLQIQRREGETWSDFPVTTTVRGDQFETWIQTSRTGKQRFRVYDESADRGSNVVTVTVG